MSEIAVEGARRPSRSLLLTAMAVWILLAIVLPLGALTLNAVSVAGYPLGFWIAAQGAPIGLAAVALFFSWRARAGRGSEGWGPPLALAGEAVSAAVVVGCAGAVAALGYDGLALSLGLIAGLALMAIAVAPRYSVYPASSLSEFFTARFGGVWPKRIAFLIAAAASVLLLAADIRAGALALQVLIGADVTLSAAILTAAIGISWFAGRALGPRVPASIVFAALFAACAAVTLAFAFRHGGSVFSYVSYGDAMRDLAALEQKLVVDKLSDMASLRPMSSPFFHASMLNFLGLVLAIALGVAALPHILARGGSEPAIDPGAASRRAALATAWAALLVIGLAALAVFSRLGVAELVNGGVQTTSLPLGLADARGLDWVTICGTASGENVAAACSKLSGHRGVLRMQDLVFASDAFIVAAPWLAGLPASVVVAFWAAIAIAAIAAGATILKVYAGSAGGGRSGPNASMTFRGGSAVVACALLICAAWVAIAGRMDAAHLLTDGFALIAASLFPAILLGLYWRRFNGSGAVAAMLTGFGLALIYIVAVRAFPVATFEWLGGLSNAAPGAIRNFETLRTAHDAATPDQQQLLAAALHRHAATIANVGGLKPPAIVLAAAPLAVLVGVVAARLGRAGSGNFAQSQP